MLAALDENLHHLGYLVLMKEELHAFGLNGHEELDSEVLGVGAIVLRLPDAGHVLEISCWELMILAGNTINSVFQIFHVYIMNEAILILFSNQTLKMGNDGSRVIEVDNMNDELASCQLLGQKNCPVYGAVQYVQYNGIQFYLGESLTLSAPHPMSLHYLIPPNLLVISEFTLLEDINPSSLDNLLQIISGISEMALNGGDIGIGYGRIAYAGRWGVVGEHSVNWPYQEVFERDVNEGIYLSPQLMISLSQGRNIPKHTVQKSDVFALGVMLVEMVFQEKLFHIFDYQNFEINLKPLLEKLYTIRQQYGDQLYDLFLSMLEIEQNQRIGFNELYSMVQEMRKTRPKMISSRMTSSTHSKDMQRGSRTPTRGGKQNAGFNKSPTRQYSNNLSPFRARPNQNKRTSVQTGRTPDGNRQRQQTSRSPLRRELKINTEFGKQSSNYPYGMNQMNTRRPLSPISRR